MENKMRQNKHEVTNEEKISYCLNETDTGYLGLVDGEHPYVVPLNFTYYNGAIYFHGASEGRKMDIIQNNSNATFTVSQQFGTITDPVPAKTDTAYMSVMVFGTVEVVTDLDEATEALQQILTKYVPNYYSNPLSKNHVKSYVSSLGSKTAVCKITPSSITAKENELISSKAFYPGRTAEMDLKS
ncbi:pyridoxamine 5'-phosphate oxidase family protein [Gottfriedia endophytica]|nr:pyridoxamine 5'-phosphate oxidase family protein [Gottfriedia endophytica]